MKVKSLFCPRWMFLYLLIIGVVIASYSFFLPRYVDVEKKESLESDCFDGKITKDVYYAEVAKLTTPKNKLMDLGSGLAVFSAMILAFLFASKTATWSDFMKLSTKKKPFYYIASNIALLLLIPGSFWYYSYRGARGDYPMFADSIGIPIYSEVLIVFIMLIPMNLFLLLALMRSQFPAQLLYWPKRHQTRGVVWEVVFGLCLLLNLVFLVESVLGGDHVSIVVNICFVYIILSLRAGKMLFLDSFDDDTVEEIAIQNSPLD